MGFRNTDDNKNIYSSDRISYDSSSYAFVDVEVGVKDHAIHDIGAIRYDGQTFHKVSIDELLDFITDIDYVCGHNIIHQFIMMPGICSRIDQSVSCWSIRYIYPL